jgi:alpha-L-fucosidase 2
MNEIFRTIPIQRVYILIVILLCLLQEGNAQAIYAGRYKAVFTSPPGKVPTAKTPDGPLAGNGDIGLTLGGKPDKLLFYLGKNDFWRAYPVYPGGGIALPGWLEVHIPALSGASYYAEQIQDKAEITGRFTKDSLTVQVKTWVSATANTVVVELGSNKACSMDFALKAAEGNTSVNAKGVDAGTYWVTRSFQNTPLLAWPAHVAMAVKVLGAKPGNDGHITLKPDSKLTLVVTMYTNFDSKDWKQKAIAVAKGTTQATVNQLRKDHYAWWEKFWKQSAVQIGDPFLEKYYYASQYLFGATSRGDKFAPGIWGPFITKDSAAWGGDYHLNYNYQAPYWAAYSSNHIDETDNFDKPLLDYMTNGKQHATELLGIRGIYYPVGIGPMGLVTTRWPLTADEMERRYASRENTIDGGYKFLGQKINAVFSVGNMLMRFYSTYDVAYARKVYPYMLECADFWEDYLKFEDGRYVIRMDHYNEVMPNLKNKGQWRQLLGDFNSTLSVGLVKMLFKGIIDVSRFLKADAGRVQKWEHIVTHMSKFTVGEVDGKPSLKGVESSPSPIHSGTEGLARVSIHGLLLPAGVCGPKTDSAFNRILLGDVSRWRDKMKAPGDWANTLGNGIETCFPAAVRVGYDADEIMRQLTDRIKRQSLPNLWITAEGGGIETLSAVPLTINEMMMQSYEGIVRIFPNWNKTKNAAFDQLRAYGAFLVSSRLEQGEIAYVRLLSEAGRPCLIENPWPGHKVQLLRNGRKAEELNGSTFSIPTTRGERLEIVKIFAPKPHLLIVTGGHGFEKVPFYNMMDSLGNFSYDKIEQPKANELIASPKIGKYDAIVFYDMNDSITAPQKQAYLQALQKGKAMIFLHHALVSYQNWDTFQQIIGGKYYAKATLVNGDTLKSSYQHDVVIPVKIENREHPVTRGLTDFEIFDEVYGNFGTQPTIRPLLSTTHSGSSKYIAWTNPFGQSEVLFIQLGHGPEAFGNPNYRKLLRQGIEWSILNAISTGKQK